MTVPGRRRIAGLVAAIGFALVAAVFWAPPPAAAVAQGGVQLLLALDVSGSMRSTDPLRLLPKAAVIVLSLLTEDDELGILAFEDVTKVIYPLGPMTAERRRQGQQALRALSPKGLYTDIYTVLAEALQILSPDSGKRRAVLLLSDGHMDINPKKGDSTAFVQRLHQELLPAYAAAKIPIFTVAFSSKSDQELLRCMAVATGGRFLPVLHARELHLAFTWLYDNLKQPQMAPIVGDRFLLDASVREAVLIASREKEWQAITLIDPNGRKHTLKDHPPHIHWYAAPTFDMVTITSPQTGLWTIHGFAPGEGKVILMTDLKLVLPHFPEEPGADEALLVGAALWEKDQPVTATLLLENLSFLGTYQFDGQEAVTQELREPPVEHQGLWPPQTRLARFPPSHRPGQAVIKVQAMGKTFQRELTRYVAVSSPWLQVGLNPQEGGPPSLICRGAPGRTIKNPWGWLSLQSCPDKVVTTFITPPGSLEFSWPLITGRNGPQVVDLCLWGTTLTGRPLLLRPGPWRVDLSDAGAVQTTPAANPGVRSESHGPQSTRLTFLRWLAFMDRRLWLAGGLLFFGGAAGWFLWRRRAQPLAMPGGEGIPAPPTPEGGESAEQLNLLLKAQVQALEQERLELKMALEELRSQLDTVRAEKAHLAGELEKLSASSQQHLKVIQELEKRLETAETEAKSVQMEYMNLFARNAEEKKTLTKD